MLKNIAAPTDIHDLSEAQLKDLAKEIRSVIIETVSENGGHLASNLGTVELTIALHRALKLPRDKLVFDVGHQAYTHKLLTGRFERFKTLRQQGGVGGFLRPDESEYDVCATGHSSSAISIALGLARARDLMHDAGVVVAVVGDGALTGGMCYEALNDAGQSKIPLIVILNDNAMSIAPNVGALSGYLTALRQSTSYRSFKGVINTALQKIPGIGAPIARVLEKIRDIMRSMIVGDHFFQALGFQYLGPIDGHNIRRLTRVITRAKNAKKPVLVHVVTQKGMGYAPAEARPDVFHGVAPFFVDTGCPAHTGHLANGQIVASELNALAQTDARVCAVCAAMPGGTGLDAFAAQYPDRFFDVGIAEAHAVTMAAGLAIMGMRPYVGIYSTFLQRAYDQILEDVCLQGQPVTLLIDRAGLVGSDGATHQGVFDIAYLRQMPGLVVASPRDARDLRRLIHVSLTLDGPMAIRYPKDAWDMGSGMQEKGELTVGEWEMLAAGEDVVIFAVGSMVELALTTSIELHGKGIACCVVDARFIKPLDENMLSACANNAHLIVTLEEGVVAGGFGEAVLNQLTEWGKTIPFMALGVPDRFIEQGTHVEQLADCGLSVEQICDRVLKRLVEVRRGDTAR